MNFHLRLAQQGDIAEIEALMKRSMRALGVGHYSQEQIDSCCQYVCVPDQQLIADQTFFIVQTKGVLVGCGGWSFRNKLYAGPTDVSQSPSRLDPSVDAARIRAMFTDPDYSGRGIGSLILNHSELALKEMGFSRGALGSTLSGFSFYDSKGWQTKTAEQARLPDGVSIEVIQMQKLFE